MFSLMLTSHWCFPGGSVVKNLPANTGDASSVPGLGRSPGEGNKRSTPGFLPGESHRQRNLKRYMGSQSDTTGHTCKPLTVLQFCSFSAAA